MVIGDCYSSSSRVGTRLVGPRGTREVAPQYRTGFTAPAFIAGPHSTHEWIDWMQQLGILHDFAVIPEGACQLCGGSMLNDRYTECFTCSQRFGPYLDALIIASYSLDSGLESMLHRYKDGDLYQGKDAYTWLRAPLGSLLSEFATRHKHCIESVVGTDVVFTWVPAGDARAFDHIEMLVRAVGNFYEGWPWRPGVLERELEVPKPRAQQLSPAAYRVTEDVEGRSFVLVDDVWTSGASLGSAAAALRLAGASQVVGLTLGRSLNRDYAAGNNQELYQEVEARSWTNEHCSICA